MVTLTTALKEWAVAVDALAAGETILLQRKGGIRETGKRFTVTHNSILLYPTYEHQKPELLKPEYAQQVQLLPSGWRPTTITIRAWSQITHISQISNADKIESLMLDHIWNQRFVTERFQWKPHQPLYILLLRTYRLSEAIQLPYHANYGGCRSWIDLIEPISIDGAAPVLNHADYISQVETIQQRLGTNNRLLESGI